MSSHTSNSPSMAADLKAILEQHQNVLASEIEDGRVVQFLVQHGTLSVSEVEDFQRRTNKNERVAFFCSLIADKGFSAFRDLCLALEKECPHLLTNFLLESARVPGLSMSPSPSSSSSPLAPPPPAPSSSSRICPSPNRRSRLSVTSSTSSRCTSPSPGDSTSPLATPLFPPTLPPQVLTHTPPLERRPPSRAPSAASLLSPFASLTRRLGAKHKKTKNRDLTDHATARMTTPLSLTTSSRGPTPADFGGAGGLKGSNHSRPVSPASAYSIYSTFPRPPPSSSPSATHPPLIHQLLMANASRNSSPANLLSDRRTPSFLLDRHSPLPALPPRPPSESNPLALVLATPTTTLAEVLDEPVEEEGGDRVSWEYHQLALNRVPGYGFGIAVSGGRDNPHFANGDPAIAISDVLKGGPAEGKLQINDRVLSANGVSLDNVDYATAVQVLRDSGAAVHLVVKRRIVHGASSHGHAPGDTYKVTLTKSKKKEDFGLTFGSRLYVKELNHKALQEQHGLQEGDWVVQINTTPTEGLSLKEAKKLMDAAKDKLTLTIRREQPAVVTNGVSPGGGATALATNGHILGMVPVNSPNGRLHDPNVYDPTQSHPKEGYGNYESRGGYSHSSQNLYVQPPTRGGSIDYNRLGGQHQSPSNPYEEKSNLSRVQAQNGSQSQSQGRSRGPIMDLSLSQLDQPLERREDGDEPPPPRPPPPRPEDYYSSGRRHPSEDLSKVPMPDPRFISFQKEGSVGIRLTGGNHVGIFVTAVQPGSPAALQGLTPGDKILKVNEMDMKGVTREEAVLFLLSLQDQIDLIVQHRRDEYDMVLASGHGDSFYVKTHFTYDHPKPGELAFRKGEVFHVLDTLHNGVVGAWQVARIGASNTEVQKGVIPNSSTAEELATAQFNAAKKEATASESRGSFFRRRRSSQRRSKSLGRDHWDEVVFAETLSKFPAYERVVLRHPGFVRPVVLFGAVADLARDKLLKDYPDKFASPLDVGSHGHAPRIEDNTPSDRNGPSNGGIVRLSAIRDLVEKGRHALLDITPGAVDKLNYAQFYPVVIFLRPDSKHAVKELRAGVPKSAHRSSKKMYEQCVKLEKLWSHVFTVVVPTTSRDTWYRKLREAIDREQNTPIWVSETKLDEYLSDDFLFPMTSRLSYASSPESDLDLSPEPRPLNAMGGAGGGAGGGMGGKSSAHATSSPSGGATGGPRLVKSSSDPSIATQEDLGHAHISHFQSQVPPPYAHAPNQQFDPRGYEPSPKRPSSDAKYGFGASKESRGRHSTHMAGNEVPPPDLPPRVDRSSKPGFPGSTPETSNPGRGGKMSHSSHPAATSTSRSAQERLFGVKEESPGDETGLGNGNAVAWTAKDRPGPDNHPGMSYDSSSSYESYNRLGLSLALPPPGHSLEPREHSREDPNKNGGRSAPPLTPTSPTSGRSPHDPYRFTRSTSQPVRSPSDPPISVPPGTTSHLDHAAKYSSSRNNYEYKPSPPPKSYKPVPPPKPKNYRPPNLAVSSTTPTSPSTNTNTTTTMTNNHSSHNYWNHSPPSTLHYYQSNGTASRGRIPNGISEDVDSGQGSSLDRHAPTTPTSPRSQYYYNLPPPRVDLAQHRERGSAFELYQKPKDPRAPYHAHHAEHNVSVPPKNSVLSTARGWFGSEGGRLDTPEGVALIVPPGALPEGSRQEMYIQVCGDQALYPPLDQDKGEQLLSPLVLCGPHGLRFLRPVELQLPHHAPPPADTTDPPTAPAAATPSPAFRMALKASDTPQSQWQQLPLDTDNQPCPNNNNKVSVFVDHF